MPELPEVEVLVRHLGPWLQNRTIRSIEVRRQRVLRPTTEAGLKRALLGAKFAGLSRRGKYLVFSFRQPRKRAPIKLLGHLGMTGRMYLQAANAPVARHAAVVLILGKFHFIFEDTRYFGRFTLDTTSIESLGPEPLGGNFTPACFAGALKKSRQPIKVKLLDQSLLAGLGNIYASEALFDAGISPRLPARRLTRAQALRLRQGIRKVLNDAITLGSTIPLNFSGNGKHNGLFYHGQAENAPEFYEERLRVYGRTGRPCRKCGAPVKRIIQAARSTFFCPRCQPSL